MENYEKLKPSRHWTLAQSNTGPNTWTAACNFFLSRYVFSI